MDLYRFPNEWDYHNLGAFIVLASSPDEAASMLNDLMHRWEQADEEARAGLLKEYGWFPGAYGSGPFPRWTADEATAVGPIFIQEGCDD